MGRYKMLVAGKGKTIVDDIFSHLKESFEIISTSPRFDDVVRHVNLFSPDVFIICLNGENAAELAGYADLKRKLTSSDVETVIVGNEEDCLAFAGRAPQMADLILKKPISVDMIREEVVKMLTQREKDRDLEEVMLKKLEELRNTQDKKRVLVIDDDPIMLKLVKEYLGDDYLVATAISGKIAYKYLEAKETNLILLDYEMPDENGIEVLMKIRANPKLANIPVVFFTGISDRDMLYKVLLTKPQGYLMKPVDKDKLIGTIEKFIG